MSEFLYMVLALVGGLILGTLFFGGLWFTVQKAVTAKMPALWFLISFLLRVGVLLTGFYFISIANWQRFLVCLLGFIIARYLVIYLTKKYETNQSLLKKEMNNEA